MKPEASRGMCRQRANTAPVDVEDPHERLSGEVVCRGSRQVDSNPVSRFHHHKFAHKSHIRAAGAATLTA